MIDSRPDFEMLSAYVDGELSVAETSWIDGLAATDETIARQVATLSAMKSGIAGTASEVIIVRAPARNARLQAPAFLAMAAALVAFVVGGLLWASPWLARSGNPQMPQPIAQALSLHDDWIAAGPASPTPVAATPDFVSPNLEAAGLQLVTVVTDLKIDGRRAIQAGYLGRHGCRLSLFRFDDEGLDGAFHINSFGTLQFALWAQGPLRYIMIARDMDSTRFAVLAAAMKAMTIEKAPSPRKRSSPSSKARISPAGADIHRERASHGAH